MKNYIPVKKSQLAIYKEIPFYYLSKKGEGVLFKKAGVFISKKELDQAKTMEVYIHRRDRDRASKEMIDSLNMALAKKIASKGVRAVRLLLCDIVNETLNSSLEASAASLPNTIEVIFNGYYQNTALFEALTQISTNSPIRIEHSVNVLAFTMLYCCYHDVPLGEAKKLGIAALLHDIGTTQIDKAIINKEERLSEKEYGIFKAHTTKGHDLIQRSNKFEKITAVVALEHHEKLDGSGYPNGITNMCFESQLIGLIDSYEPLTYRETSYRRARKPFDSMNILKQEVVSGQFDKEIFKNFTACLTR